MIASGIICAIYVLCAVILFFGVREKKGKESSSSITQYSLGLVNFPLTTHGTCGCNATDFP